MKLYFNHSLLEDTSHEEANSCFQEIVDLKALCRDNKIDLRFFNCLWELRVGNISLNELIMQNRDTLLLLIQAVNNGPFFSNDCNEISLVIEPNVNPNTFGKTLLSICYLDKQVGILSMTHERVLSKKEYHLTESDTPSSRFKVLNNMGKAELLSHVHNQLEFRSIDEVFTKIVGETQTIEILDSARKSAKKHDFRSFYIDVYDAIMGLEQTELEMILQDKNEIERKKAFYDNHCCEISRETSVTLKSYGKDRLFEIPGLGQQLFEWHVKIDGNRTRIHYLVNRNTKKVYIGHCGKHLPVVG